MIDEEIPLNFNDDGQPLDLDDEEFMDGQKEDEMYNPITPDGSSINPDDEELENTAPKITNPLDIEEIE